MPKHRYHNVREGTDESQKIKIKPTAPATATKGSFLPNANPVSTDNDGDENGDDEYEYEEVQVEVEEEQEEGENEENKSDDDDVHLKDQQLEEEQKKRRQTQAAQKAAAAEAKAKHDALIEEKFCGESDSDLWSEIGIDHYRHPNRRFPPRIKPIPSKSTSSNKNKNSSSNQDSFCIITESAKLCGIICNGWLARVECIAGLGCIAVGILCLVLWREDLGADDSTGTGFRDGSMWASLLFLVCFVVGSGLAIHGYGLKETVLVFDKDQRRIRATTYRLLLSAAGSRFSCFSQEILDVGFDHVVRIAIEGYDDGLWNRKLSNKMTALDKDTPVNIVLRFRPDKNAVAAVFDGEKNEKTGLENNFIVIAKHPLRQAAKRVKLWRNYFVEGLGVRKQKVMNWETNWIHSIGHVDADRVELIVERFYRGERLRNNDNGGGNNNDNNDNNNNNNNNNKRHHHHHQRHSSSAKTTKTSSATVTIGNNYDNESNNNNNEDVKHRKMGKEMTTKVKVHSNEDDKHASHAKRNKLVAKYVKAAAVTDQDDDGEYEGGEELQEYEEDEEVEEVEEEVDEGELPDDMEANHVTLQQDAKGNSKTTAGNDDEDSTIDVNDPEMVKKMKQKQISRANSKRKTKEEQVQLDLENKNRLQLVLGRGHSSTAPSPSSELQQQKQGKTQQHAPSYNRNKNKNNNKNIDSPSQSLEVAAASHLLTPRTVKAFGQLAFRKSQRHILGLNEFEDDDDDDDDGIDSHYYFYDDQVREYNGRISFLRAPVVLYGFIVAPPLLLIAISVIATALVMKNVVTTDYDATTIGILFFSVLGGVVLFIGFNVYWWHYADRNTAIRLRMDFPRKKLIYERGPNKLWSSSSSSCCSNDESVFVEEIDFKNIIKVTCGEQRILCGCFGTGAQSFVNLHFRASALSSPSCPSRHQRYDTGFAHLKILPLCNLPSAPNSSDGKIIQPYVAGWQEWMNEAIRVVPGRKLARVKGNVGVEGKWETREEARASTTRTTMTAAMTTARRRQRRRRRHDLPASYSPPHPAQRPSSTSSSSTAERSTSMVAATTATTATMNRRSGENSTMSHTPRAPVINFQNVHQQQQQQQQSSPPFHWSGQQQQQPQHYFAGGSSQSRRRDDGDGDDDDDRISVASNASTASTTKIHHHHVHRVRDVVDRTIHHNQRPPGFLPPLKV